MGRRSFETCFYISNRGNRKSSDKESVGEELFWVVRKHWGIESDHFILDDCFGEDKIRCFNKWRVRALAAIINVAVNLIKKYNDRGSITVFREEMNYDRKLVLKCLI